MELRDTQFLNVKTNSSNVVT